VKKLPLAAAPVAAGRIRTVDGESAVTMASLNGSMTLGRHVIENPEIRFAATPIGNIGYKILQQFAVTLDSKNHRVRLGPGASGPAASSAGAGTVVEAAPPTRRYGMKVHMLPDGGMEVMGTDEGSIARKAGLESGDQILGINGVKLEQISEEKRGEILRSSPITLQIERGGKSIEIRMSLDGV